MNVRKQANGNIRVSLSDTDLIDALEEKFGDIYENITETSCVQSITKRYGNIEVIIGDEEE